MKRFATLVLAASFCVGSLLALGRAAFATPPSDVPQTWEYQAFDALVADGLIEGYRDKTFQDERLLTRRELAIQVARTIENLQANGVGNASKTDLDNLQKLIDSLKDELVLLGVRVTNIATVLQPPDKAAKFERSMRVNGAILADGSFRQRTNVPQTIAGGAITPFVNAFLTSPATNSPFDHDPGPGSWLRLDNKLTLTYAMSENVAVSLPVRVIPYGGAFTLEKYQIQPALVVNIRKAGALRNAYIRAGQLDNMESSRLALTYQAPDATQQGPGFQNPVQRYENGLEVGAELNGLTKFQFSFSRVDPSMIDTSPGLPDATGPFANNNYFLVVAPPQNGLVQTGAPGSAGATSRTDTFTASAGPVPAVSLSLKAGLGTVYVSSVNGTVCPPGGAGCPIAPGQWSYVDQTNQVVFQSPLPVGTIVQITYALTGGNGGQAQRYYTGYQRYHFNTRVNQRIKGLPGTEVGLSLSRIFDAGSPGAGAGLGYGALSDTVVGLDARLPVSFIRLGGDATEHPVLFAEGAYSKYTPDFHNTPAVTDSAVVLGLRLNIANIRATAQYQVVGPNFMVGGPLRYLGPAPSTFQFWRGNYFPGFFGFANNLAINQTFDTTIFPGCAGAACSSRNANLTYIYPVFNPFVAGGPQFFSAYAPNSQGGSAKIEVPITRGRSAINGSFLVQHLREMVTNGFGQLAYGPGFASPDVPLRFDKVEADLHGGLSVFNTNATVNLTWSKEHLFRDDLTAYSYVPFNIASGGPDASASAALNAYISVPETIPVLFYPNYIDETHRTFAPSVTIPIARNFTFGVAYNTQSYRGSYGTTLSENIIQRKNDSTATLSYRIPKTTSSIVFLFGNQKYTDSVLPTYNFNQNREDVGLTIRF